MGDAGCKHCAALSCCLLSILYGYFWSCPALVGVLLLSVRVIDAVTDPVMGARLPIITQSKYGRFRPATVDCISYALFSVLMFTTPDWSYNSKKDCLCFSSPIFCFP